MPHGISTRDEAAESFEDKVKLAARQGLDSIECDSCSDGAQVIIETVWKDAMRITRISAQCENYHDPRNGKIQEGAGCGNPKITIT